MKDYLSIEKGISEIIYKLNKLKKTAKNVCINIALSKKRGKPKKGKARINTNKKIMPKGNQYSNVYKSPSNVSFNLEPSNNKSNKTNKTNVTNNKSNKSNVTNESIEISEPFESEPIESVEATPVESSETTIKQ